MKPMASELVVNENTTTFFFVSETPQERKSKKDKPYLCLKLQDKTGIIDGRVWDYPKGFDPTTIKKGSFVKIKANVGEWNDVVQLSIEVIRLVKDDDAIDLGDFFERSERDPQEMFGVLYDLIAINMRDGPTRTLLFSLLEEHREKFCQAPAAKSIHHAYLGGLLEHVLSMAQVAIPIADHYEVSREIMIAACVLHDFGKIFELTYPIGIGYSLEGSLLGHITIGMELVSRKMDSIEGFPQKMKIAILHMIASHHGLLEYGSPKVPLMKEAVIFHLIDMMDARGMMCDRAAKKGLDENGMTEWVREIGGPLFVLKED
jgi:3'-5' exoribonuclease